MVGMEWEAKAQLGLLVILLIALADFFIGSLIGPKSDLERAKGYIGFNGNSDCYLLRKETLIII